MQLRSSAFSLGFSLVGRLKALCAAPNTSGAFECHCRVDALRAPHSLKFEKRRVDMGSGRVLFQFGEEIFSDLKM